MNVQWINNDTYLYFFLSLIRLILRVKDSNLQFDKQFLTVVYKYLITIVIQERNYQLSSKKYKGY